MNANGNNGKSETTLDMLRPGETAMISNIASNGCDEADLMEMGLTSGTEIRLVKYAPLGDPIEIKVRGYYLSLRRAEAKTIVVEKVKSDEAVNR